MNSRLDKLRENLLPKEEALQVIEPFENCEELLVKGKSEFDFNPHNQDFFVMRYGNQEYSVSEDSLTKLGRLVGIPATYSEKMPKQFIFPHLSYWLADGDMGVKAFIRPSVKDSQGRPVVSSFAREDAFYYPVSRLLAQIDKVRPNYLVEGLNNITWRDSTFGIVFPEHEFNVEFKGDTKPGDFLYGGIKMRTSLIGEFPTKISAFLLTLVCLNGMVSRDEIYTFNRRSGFDGLDEWMIDGVKNALGALESEVEKVRRLTGIEIEDESIPPYVAHMFDMMNVPAKSREAVLTQIIKKHPKNLYDLMNAVTEVAHTIDNKQEVYAIQSLGGFVASHAESCNQCHRPF